MVVLSAHSWLSPYGEFHAVDGNHSSAAIALAGNDFKGGAVSALFMKGWMRVTYYGDTLYLSNDFRPPNYRQKKSAKDFALESGRFTKVVFDSGDDEKELASLGFKEWLEAVDHSAQLIVQQYLNSDTNFQDETL